MTSSIQIEFIPLRKDQLRSKISEALENGANEKLSCLRAQWVHRYGIETLKEFQQENTNCSIVKDSYEVPLAQSLSFDHLLNRPENYNDQVNNSSNQSFVIDQSNLLKEKLIDENDHSCEKTKEDLMPVLNDEIEALPSDERTFEVTPPPKPALNHLRRWLPSIGNSIPKAS